LAFEAVAREQTGLDQEWFVKRVVEPIVPTAVRGVPEVVAELGLAETVGGRRAMDIWFFDGAWDLLKPLPDVVETISTLSRDYTLGIVTNGPDDVQQAKVERLGLRGLVGYVVTSEAAGSEKPDARIFERALSLAGVQADEAVFVGDRLDVDVAGAQGAGMRAVWLDRMGGALDGAGVRPAGVIRGFANWAGCWRISRARATGSPYWTVILPFISFG